MCGLDEASEERMRLHGLTLEFRMRLGGHEVGMIFQLNQLHEIAVRRGTAEDKILRLELLTVGIVEFVPVSMTFS